MIEHVGVIVPVANEDALLEQCLRALALAHTRVQATHPGVTVQVVAVLDDCHDASELIARRWGVDIVAVAERSVGSARRAGVQHVLTGRSTAPERIWLANTDADSTAPRDWLSTMLTQADGGADLVLGTVILGPGVLPGIDFAWRAFHPPLDGHPYVHGANFGIRADAYLRLGGWPELVSGEDVALAVRAATAGDLQIRRSAATPVVTSSRLEARAPLGFSSYLRGLSALPDATEPSR
jgi:glycosyltransferase involved in cell wall biosynthesis